MKMMETKDFLYGDYDFDLLEKQVRIGVKKPAPAYVGQFNPGEEVLNEMFSKFRNYSRVTKDIRRDVTKTEHIIKKKNQIFTKSDGAESNEYDSPFEESDDELPGSK